MLTVSWLGWVSYEDALRLQERLVSKMVTEEDPLETLLLLEHTPVFTMGRSPDQNSLGNPGALPYPVYITNRGGQATYHGPGQLVGYPILDLRRRGQDLHKYLRSLEEFVANACSAFGVEAGIREGLTGVWVGERKIASIGVGVRRWISMHGFALNVSNDCLKPFLHITPCGIDGVQMTSLEAEGAAGITVPDVADWLRRHAASQLVWE